MGTLLRISLFIALAYYIAHWFRRMASEALDAPSEKKYPDPYEVLGIRRNAQEDEVRSAYRKRLAEYHPDKVATLGKDLQDFARKRTEQVIAAYQFLLQKRVGN